MVSYRCFGGSEISDCAVCAAVPEFTVDGRVAAACAEWLAYPDCPLLRGLEKGDRLRDLEVSYLKYGPVGFVTVQGGLVLGLPVDSLRQTLDNLTDHGETQLVLNLGGVDRLDSSGIGLLVKVLQTCKGAGGNVKLTHLPRVVVQTLSMCRLLPLFEVYDEDQDAIASFG